MLEENKTPEAKEVCTVGALFPGNIAKEYTFRARLTESEFFRINEEGMHAVVKPKNGHSAGELCLVQLVRASVGAVAGDFIVQLVDDTEYKAEEEKRKRAEEIRREINLRRQRRIEALEIEQLFAGDEETLKMFAELKSLST